MHGQKPIRQQLERIVTEFQEAGATKWTAIKIIKELESQKISDKKLKENAFELLKKIDQKSAQVFESFQKMKVFNSKEILANFDRGNIIHSLLKETSVSRTIAEKISTEVENKIKDLNLKHLNTSLIRELVCVKLLDLGQEKAHQEYTRIGLPVFEVQKHIYSETTLGTQTLREFNWLKNIPAEIRLLHFKSAIHLSHAHHFGIKPFATSFFFEPKTQTPQKQLIELAVEIKNRQKKSSAGLFLKSLNNSFSKTAQNASAQKTAELAELAVMQLNECFKGQPKNDNIVSVDLFDSGELKHNPKQKEKATELAQKIIVKFSENTNNEFCLAASVDSKYRLKLLEGIQKEGIFYLNCTEKKTNLFSRLIPSDQENAIRTLAGINLPKIALQEQTPESFEQKLESISKELNKMFSLNESQLAGKNFSGQQSTDAIGLFGIWTAALELGQEKQLKRFTEKTLKALYSHCSEKTAITSFYDQQGIEKFSQKDKKEKQKTQLDHPDQKELLESGFNTVFFAKTQQELETLISQKAKAVFLSQSVDLPFYQ